MRVLLVILLCLLAVVPPGLCACDHTDHISAPTEPHDDEPGEDSAPGEHHDHDDSDTPVCPCQCHTSPRDAVTVPCSASDSTSSLDTPSGALLVEAFDPLFATPVAVRNGEPPQRLHTSVPLYLSISRLRN